MTLLAKRYAQALFEATPANARDAVANDLAAISAALADPTARLAITDPNVPDRVRRKACEVMAKGAEDVVQRFVRVLLERRRERVLLDIAPAFRQLLLEARGQVEGVLETAAPIDADTLAKLEAEAAKQTGKSVSLRVDVRPELLGGVRMRVGNTLFDSSVATAIEELERKLMAAPLL